MAANDSKNLVSLGKALVFMAQDRLWACELETVKEITRSTHITPLPNAVEHVVGVINVRGEVIPVVDYWRGETAQRQRQGAGTGKDIVILLKAAEGNIGLRVRHVNAIEDIHAYDLGDDMKESSKEVSRVVSCNVFLSESGPAPLVDVRLILENLKDESMQRTSKETKDKNLDVSSSGGA